MAFFAVNGFPPGADCPAPQGVLPHIRHRSPDRNAGKESPTCTCMVSSVCWDTKAVFRKCGNCLCSWLAGCCCSNTLSLLVAQFYAPGHRLPVVAQNHNYCDFPVAGRTPCANSMVTIISYLPFASILIWIWGDQLASDQDNQPVSSADNGGLSVSPHYFIYTGNSLRIREKAAGHI